MPLQAARPVLDPPFLSMFCGAFFCLLMSTPSAPAYPALDNSAVFETASPPDSQRLPRKEPRKHSALQGLIRSQQGRPLPGALVVVLRVDSGEARQSTSNGEGVFRFQRLPPGRYQVKIESDGFESFHLEELALAAGEVRFLEIRLVALPIPSPPSPRLPRPPRWIAPTPLPEETRPTATFRTLPRRVVPEPSEVKAQPPAEVLFLPMPHRWEVPMPNWDRYAKKGEFPYTQGRWWDPFNRNKLKGDYPIIGQRTFLNLTFVSDTVFEGRRLPVPSNVSAARPGSEEFFGRGEQAFLVENLRFSFDLFHGDTAFRPFDWRLRVTPALSLNYLNTREQGIVNIDVREGTNRFDTHFGLQEAFFEAKLADLSPNFDFASVRVGIQPFNSDFRGFLFVEEQPGIRLFGTLHSNRWEYNLGYFFQLEKDTNSVLNTFDSRHQQVVVANLYLQDFLWRGYTTQFSLHYNKDDADFKFDKNDFLVRPAPVGAVRPHDVRVAYLGWTSNGHIGRLNVSHALYLAFGDDDLNPLAGQRVDINAQMVAAELSYDRDWLRLKGSFFWASGDSDPRDHKGRGFDAIVDLPVFAGGIFSLWSRQGIRLTGTGVALVNPNSLLPSLRPNKEQGQANFVNPGLFLYNVGADVELTPKLRGLVNVNFLSFHRTESLELLDFQAPIRTRIGVDTSVGFQYRPPLSENVILTGGFAFLSPGGGFRDLFTNKTLFSLFSELRLQF